MRRADPAFMRPTLAQNLTAVLVTAAALGLTLLLDPIHEVTPSVLFLAAVIASSWYGGLLPGLLSVILSTLALNFFVLPPRFAFTTSAEGAVSGAVFLLTSVLIAALHTQRNRALLALREERDRLRVTMTSIGDAVITTDPEGRIVFMNPPAEALTGWPLSEAHGRLLPEVFRITNESTGQPVESPVDRVLREGKVAGLANHTVLIRRDGTPTAIDDSAAPIRDAEGGLLGVILVFRDVTHRRGAEKALHDSEERFRLMAETVPNILFITLPGGLLEYVNPRFYEYTGLPDGSGLGTGWEAALHPDDIEHNRADWRRAEQAGEPYRSEFLLRSAEGSYRWFVSRARPIFDADGKIARWYGACTDIDRERRSQRALEEANARLRDTLESITEAYFALDSEFRFLEINPVARRFFRNRPDEELLGRVFWEAFPEAVGSDFYQQYQHAMETNQPVHFEGHSRIVSGWFEVHAYPRGGRLEVYLRDITDRKRAEERMALLQQLTAGFSRAATREEVGAVVMETARSLLGSHLCSVMLLAEDGKTLEIIGDLGLQREALEPFRRLPLSDPTPMSEAIRTAQPVWVENPDEYARRFPQVAESILPRTRTQSSICAPLMLGDRVIGGVGFSFPEPRTFDEEDRRFFQAIAEQCAQAIERARLYEIEAQARHAAEEADQIRVKFLGMVSHELRNPLTSIKGFASTLLAEDVTWDQPTQNEFIRLINEEADKLSDLVEQLLDLSRMETGNFSIQPVPTTPREIVDAALSQLSLITSKHQLDIDLAETLPPVVADTRRIAQVLNNLVGNAAKFSPPGTTIHVQVRPSDNGVQFDVTDQGSGVSPEDRTRIFEAFRQGRQQPGQFTKGAGLGLAIARGLVEAHRGRLWIQDRPGPGATFSFLLPAAPPHFSASQPAR